MANTYTSLFNQVLSILDRTGDLQFEEILPTFINQAQIAIARDKKFLGFQVSYQGQFEAGVEQVAKPAGWRETVSFNYGTETAANPTIWNPLLYRQYEYIRGMFPILTYTGEPQMYADWDFDHWLIGPKPDQAYFFEVLIYQTPAELTEANQTNWLTQYAPDILMWQTLLQCAPYLKNDSRIAVWQSYYEQAVGKQAIEFNRRIVDRVQVAKPA